MPRIFAVGFQKSGSTFMTATIARAFNTTANLEGAWSCCCCGHPCEADSSLPSGWPRNECVDATHLYAPLFGGNTNTYLSQCAEVFDANIVKADDMLWQIDELMREMRLVRRFAETQFVFYVRHPIFNVRSLIAWCAPSVADCARDLRTYEAEGNNNTLFQRVFADRQTGRLTADPTRLAASWKAGARARTPHRTR